MNKKDNSNKTAVTILAVSALLVAVSVAYYIFIYTPTQKKQQAEARKIEQLQQARIKAVSDSDQKITEQEAVELVKNRKEVKEWLSLFSGPGPSSLTTGGVPKIEFDHLSDGNYVIHVYEAMPDHSATMNWYIVNIKTGEISKEF